MHAYHPVTSCRYVASALVCATKDQTHKSARAMLLEILACTQKVEEPKSPDGRMLQVFRHVSEKVELVLAR